MSICLWSDSLGGKLHLVCVVFMSVTIDMEIKDCTKFKLSSLYIKLRSFHTSYLQGAAGTVGSWSNPLFVNYTVVGLFIYFPFWECES